MTIGEIVAIISAILALFSAIGGLLYYAYKFGGFTEQMTNNVTVTSKIYAFVSKVDEEVEGIKLDMQKKVDQKDFDMLKEKVISIETQHKMNHGGY